MYVCDKDSAIIFTTGRQPDVNPFEAGQQMQPGSRGLTCLNLNLVRQYSYYYNKIPIYRNEMWSGRNDCDNTVQSFAEFLIIKALWCDSASVESERSEPVFTQHARNGHCLQIIAIVPIVCSRRSHRVNNSAVIRNGNNVYEILTNAQYYSPYFK
jgi:hypothetical protein